MYYADDVKAIVEKASQKQISVERQKILFHRTTADAL